MSDKKLVGSLYLDLSQLKQDIDATNNLLKSIGLGVNLNMTDIVRSQVKETLDKLVSETKKASSGMSAETKKMASDISTSVSKIATLTSETVKFSGTSGSVLTSVKKGYTELGQAITEVWKNGSKISSSVSVSNNIGAANTLYREQSNLLKTLYETKTKIATTTDQGALTGLKEQEAATQSLIDKNAQIISGMDSRIVQQSKLVNLAAEENTLKEKLAVTETKQYSSQGSSY